MEKQLDIFFSNIKNRFIFNVPGLKPPALAG
jgi:hypothetical protein